MHPLKTTDLVPLNGIYRFGEGSITDYEPAFLDSIKQSGENLRGFYALIGTHSHSLSLPEAESAGRFEDASTLFLRTAAVFRISRFPMPRTELTRSIWEESKKAFAKGTRYLDPAPRSVNIPFINRSVADGDTDGPIPAELWLPTTKKPNNGWPLIMFIGGIDGYRIDVMVYARPLVAPGYAMHYLDCPGIGDNPAAPNDPISPDRWISSIIAWARRIMGGYYAMRAAHTNPDDLLGAVAQGGCAHHVFDPAWIGAQNQMEFAYAFVETLAWKFGYRGSDAIERYTAEAHKFSSVNTGLLAKPSCRLLIINGMEDTLWPIEDCILIATSGTNVDPVINTENNTWEIRKPRTR